MNKGPESFLDRIKRLANESQAKIEAVRDSVDNVKANIADAQQILGIEPKSSNPYRERATAPTPVSAAKPKCMLSESFGMHHIKIYDNGQIKIGSRPAETLLAIDGAADIQTKSGAGRAAVSAGLMAVALIPVNLMAPNTKGLLMLTIVTNKKTHVFKTTNTFAHEIKSLRKIAATGNAVLESVRRGQSQVQAPSVTGTASPDITVQLAKLAELFEAGILTAEEFASAKALLLSS